MTTPGRPPLRAEGMAINCGRPHHPPNYAHTCPPQCESLSARSGARCEKDDGHEEWHWTVKGQNIEVWGIPLGSDRKDARG